MADPLAARMAELNGEVEEFESFVNDFGTIILTSNPNGRHRFWQTPKERSYSHRTC